MLNSIDEVGGQRVILRYVDTLGAICEVELKQVAEEVVLGKDPIRKIILSP
ncbi:MAG TPA: hypothetical protein VF131_10120 [Blastocatellia bacterium]|nr:hypothetical protein [Blastocatellia bacterium]